MRYRLPTVEPVLSGHLKRDNIKVLMENGSLMKVESMQNAAIRFDLHLVIICNENQFLVFILGGLRQVLLYSG